MKTAPSSAQRKAATSNSSAETASDVPTSTGATAAGSVRTRAAMTQMRTAEGVTPCLRPVGASDADVGHPGRRSWAARELREVGLALLLVGLAPLPGFLVGVE